MITMDTLFLRMTRITEQSKNQEKVMAYLREFGFTFITYARLLAHATPMELEPMDNDKYMTFFIRQIEKDLYDPRLFLGIKLNGKKRKLITIYFKGVHWKTIEIAWKDEADINFRKTVNKIIFPNFMTYDERRKWRRLYDKLQKDPSFEPGKWYYKCLNKVQWINGGY